MASIPMISEEERKREHVLTSLYGSVVCEARLLDFLDQAQTYIQARFLVLGMFDPHEPERHAHRFSAPRSIGPEGALEFLALAAQSHVDGSQKMLDAEPQRILLDQDVYPGRVTLDERPTMKLLREKYQAPHIGVVNAQINRAWVDYLMFAHRDAEFRDVAKVRARVASLVPHISVASEIRRAFVLLEQRYRAVFAALSYLRYGVALILDSGELFLANEAFEAMVDAQDGLRLDGERRLRARDDQTDSALQAALSEVTARGDGVSASAPRRTLTIRRSRPADPYILDLAPFVDGIGGELNLEIRGALLFMVDPEQAAMLAHQGLVSAFALTPAEGSVCRHVLDGLSNREIADAHGTTLPTVKTQVSAVFSKTRVTDRAGLIRLASRVTPPLIEPS